MTRADMIDITPELLRELLRYEPETGKLFWKHRTPDVFQDSQCRTAEHVCSNWNARFAGKPAFTTVTNGYKQGSILCVKLSAHRVIWAMQTDEWPVQVDHINGIRHENWWGNLRHVNNQVNSRNAGISIRNTSGVVGVSWAKRKRKWIAQITDSGKNINLGYYNSKEDATRARKDAEAKIGFHENHGRPSK